MFAAAPYEVEFRCRFDTEEEAFRAVPFLESSLVRSVTWTDAYYGLHVFLRGEVLRFSTVSEGGTTRSFLGWKGPDGGTFANVRQELDEEIVADTARSTILGGFTADDRVYDATEVVSTLERSGYQRFMGYEGRSLTGHHEPLGLSTKLMHCATIRWPLLVELEKSAASEEEALRCERDLLDMCRRYGLGDRVVREEPGTLLYESAFGALPDL